MHLSSGAALLAVAGWVREQNLVNHDVVNVDLLFGEFDGQTLSLIHGEEFGNANCHECCLVSVLELLRDFLDAVLHLFHTFEKGLLHVLTVAAATHHSAHRVKHASKFLIQFEELMETLV